MEAEIDARMRKSQANPDKAENDYSTLDDDEAAALAQKEQEAINSMPHHSEDTLAAVESLQAEFPSLKVVAFDGAKNLPEKGLKAAKKRGHDPEKINGFVDESDGVVYINTQRVRPHNAAALIIEEHVGHAGIESLFSQKDLDEILDLVARDHEEALAIFAKEYAPKDPEIPNQYDISTVEGRRKTAKEMIAHGSTKRIKPAYWKEVIYIIRKWLRKIPGLKNLRFTDTEIEGILSMAYRHMQKQKTQSAKQGIEFALNEEVTDQDIQDFLDKKPEKQSGSDHSNKLIYHLDSEKYSKKVIFERIKDFINLFQEYDRKSPLIGKFGHRIFFEPHDKAFSRLSKKEAYIEYALHFFTAEKEKHVSRIIDDSKMYVLPEDIFDILNNAVGYIPDKDGKIIYVKQADKGKKLYDEIVLRPDESGLIVDFYRATAQLPEHHLSDKKIMDITGNPVSGYNKPRQSDRPVIPDYVNNVERSGKKSSDNVKFSIVSPEEDAAYLDAVKAGDTATAQKLVDEAAKKAGLTLGTFIHRSDEKFNQFKENERGLWFSTKKAGDTIYGKNKIKAYLVMRNPHRYTKGEDWTGQPSDSIWENTFQQVIDINTKIKEGYDSLITPSKDVAVFSPSQIKSADPVTYDDAGNPIPLSERFNEKSSDIRFSIGDEDKANWKTALDSYKAGTLDMTKNIVITKNTPKPLTAIGADDLPIVMAPSVIKKVTEGKHELEFQELYKLIENIYNPIGIFQSARFGDAFLVMTDMKEGRKTVIIALHLNTKEARHEVNEIKTIYGKTKDLTLVDWIIEKRLLFMDKQKILSWSQSRGLQLPKEGTTKGINPKLITKDDLIKSNSKKSTQFSIVSPEEDAAYLDAVKAGDKSVELELDRLISKTKLSKEQIKEIIGREPEYLTEAEARAILYGPDGDGRIRSLYSKAKGGSGQSRNKNPRGIQEESSSDSFDQVKFSLDISENDVNGYIESQGIKNAEKANKAKREIREELDNISGTGRAAVYHNADPGQEKSISLDDKDRDNERIYRAPRGDTVMRGEMGMMAVLIHAPHARGDFFILSPLLFVYE